MKKILSTAIAALTMTLTAQAGGDFTVAPLSKSNAYVGIGFGLGTSEAESPDIYIGSDLLGSINADSLFIQAGYNFGSNLAVEARYTSGFEDGISDTSFDTFALYVKPQVSVNTDITVYGLLGYTWSTAYADTYNSVDFDGLSYGVGAKYEIAQAVEVFVDYINVYSDSILIDGHDLDQDLYSVNLGVSYKF